MWNWISRLANNQDDRSLNKAEFDLVALLRLSPSEPLNGKDLALAQAMTSKGLLRAAGARRYVLTERALVAYRAGACR